MGTFFPGCVFFKVRFLQIPWHLSTWNVFYLFVVIYWIQVPFVSWAAPEKWSAFGLASCIRSRIYHWRSDPFPDFQFSQSNILIIVCLCLVLPCYSSDIGRSMDIVTKYSLFSITSSEIIMKMSDSNSIIYLLLLSLDDLSDNFKKKNANINNKTIFLMIYASRKKATLHKNTQPVITCYI